MNKMRLGLAAVLLAAFTSLLGCTRVVNRAAERRVRDQLATLLGPATKWLAHIDNPAERTVAGRIEQLTITGSGVRLRDTITCEVLEIVMRDMRIERDHVTEVGVTTFRARITEADLNRYLQEAPAEEAEPTRIKSVTVSNGKLVAKATRRILGREFPYTVSVNPRLASVEQLVFEPNTMTILGLPVPLPAVALRWLAAKLSDGFDFSKLPFPVRVTHFTAEDGAVELRGFADVLVALSGKRLSDYLKPSDSAEAFSSAVD